MNAFAEQFHSAIQQFLTALDTAIAVSFDTEFTAQNVKISNPFATQQEIFNQMKASVNLGQVLQIGLVALQHDNTVEKFGVMISDKRENPLRLDNLKFLMQNGFDIYKYYRQAFAVNVCYQSEIQAWLDLFNNYNPQQCKDTKMSSELSSIAEQCKRLRAKGEKICFESHINRANYIAHFNELQDYIMQKSGCLVAVTPVLFNTSAEEQIYVDVREVDDVKRTLMEKLNYVNLDIQHINLVFEKIAALKILQVGFCVSQDVMLLYSVLSGRQLSTYEEFAANIKQLFPRYLDLTLPLQHPLATEYIDALGKSQKMRLQSKSLVGYYKFFVNQQDENAHDAVGDALMTLKLYQEVNAFYALQQMQPMQLKEFENRMSVYGCFTVLGGELPYLYPIFPVFISEEAKNADKAVRKAVEGLQSVSANLVHGSQVGQAFIRGEKVKPIRVSSIFDNQGRPRGMFKCFGDDNLLNQKFGKIMTPAAARELYDMMKK